MPNENELNPEQVAALVGAEIERLRAEIRATLNPPKRVPAPKSSSPRKRRPGSEKRDDGIDPERKGQAPTYEILILDGELRFHSPIPWKETAPNAEPFACRCGCGRILAVKAARWFRMTAMERESETTRARIGAERIAVELQSELAASRIHLQCFSESGHGPAGKPGNRLVTPVARFEIEHGWFPLGEGYGPKRSGKK